MAFDATVGGSSSNSYVSLADANTYFTDRANPAEWANASDTEKQAALMYATTYLDNTFSWYSRIISSQQALNWPRAAYTWDSRTIGGSGVIPQAIKDATCELALQHLIGNEMNGTGNEGVKSETVGNSSITYTNSSKSFSFVKMSLRKYGTSGGANSNVIWRA